MRRWDRNVEKIERMEKQDDRKEMIGKELIDKTQRLLNTIFK